MIYSTGVCKSFPPPLVRGGVFLVGLETKYRDIADGNVVVVARQFLSNQLETKYRDIADGNRAFSSCSLIRCHWLETKYRDIADSKQVY